MRRVSGKISLATRRIWGDPEDEDELSAITNSGLKYNGSKFTTSIEEGGHSESAYNDDVKLRAKLIDSEQVQENDGELPVATKKSKSLLGEKHSLLSTDSDTPVQILYNPLTKATLPEQTDRDFKKDGDSSGHDSISSSVVYPPLSFHDASRKDFAPFNDTMLISDHIEAPQDLHKSMNISHQCSKINIEAQRIPEVLTKAENQFFASENSNPQENVTSTDGPCFDEHIYDSVFENAVEDCSLIPVAIESKDLISRNTDPSGNLGKTQLNCDVIELNNDKIPKIFPSKPNKLESCDEKVSNNLENEISQVSALLEIENQLTSKSSSEFHLQLCSKEIDDGNDTVHVAEPIIFNENCVNQDYMSSSVTDLPDSLAIENKQNINEASDKKTSTNLDLNDEIFCLDQALPLRSHLESKNNARDSVSLDENESSRCTEIIEHTSVEFANPITSNSILNVAKDASDENNLAGLNVHENQMRSQIIGISNEEVDEGYTLITAHNNLYDKARASDTKFEDNHDCSRKYSNIYSDCTNNTLTNVQDSKENDNILNLSDGDGKYYCIQSSGLKLPDIVNQHTAIVESIAHKDKSLEKEHKTNNIHKKGFENTQNLLEVNCTSEGEMFLNNDPSISNSAEIKKSNLLNADNSNISVKDLELDTEKYEVYLKDSNEAENGADEGSKNKNDEKIDEILERIEDRFGDTTGHTAGHTTTDITTNNTADTTADKIEDRIEDKTEEILDKIEDIITDTTADVTADIAADINVDTTAERIEDRTEKKAEEILDRNPNTTANTTTDATSDITADNIVYTTLDKIKDRIDDKTEDILNRIEDIITDTTADVTADTTVDVTADIAADINVNTTAERIEDRTEDKTEKKAEEILDRITDTSTNTTADATADATADITADNIVYTTVDKIEDRIDDKTEEILNRIEDIITDTTADSTADNNAFTTAERVDDRTENKAEEIIEEITDRIGDTTTDTTASRVEDCNEDRMEEKTEEKFLEILSRIEGRTEANAKDVVENRVIEKVISQGKNHVGDDIGANFFKSEASKSENIGDKNDYNYSEVHGNINAHGTDLTISNDLKIESVAPIDEKFGKDNKKPPLEGVELSETETVKATRNRKTWLRYVKSFEKRHEEGDSSSIRLSSGRESSGQSERVDRGETIAFTPKIPETPMKKKYAPSHSDSITPEKRRRSFRKKIKEKISDTLHKLKD